MPMRGGDASGSEEGVVVELLPTSDVDGGGPASEQAGDGERETERGEEPGAAGSAEPGPAEPTAERGQPNTRCQ